MKTRAGAVRDQIRQPLYDTITLDDAINPVGERSFYSVVQGKNRRETNLRQPRQLEGQVSYRIQGMKIDAQSYYAANANLLAVYMDYSFIKLHIGEKDYWEGPMRYASGNLHVHDAVAAGAGEAIERHYSQFGIPNPCGIMFKKLETLDIAPLQSFYVDWLVSGLSAAELALATPAADTKVAFLCKFKGLQRRPVQ